MFRKWTKAGHEIKKLEERFKILWKEIFVDRSFDPFDGNRLGKTEKDRDTEEKRGGGST